MNSYFGIYPIIKDNATLEMYYYLYKVKKDLCR